MLKLSHVQGEFEHFDIRKDLYIILYIYVIK